MDPLAVGVVVFVIVLVGIALMAARVQAGKPLSEFGSRRGRAPSGPVSEQLEYQDMTELLEATNVRRRAQGLPERTVSDVIREFGGE